MASVLTSDRVEPTTKVVEGYSRWLSAWKWVKHAGSSLQGLVVAEISRLASAYVRRHVWVFVVVAICVAGLIGALANWWKHRKDVPAEVTVIPIAPEGKR